MMNSTLMAKATIIIPSFTFTIATTIIASFTITTISVNLITVIRTVLRLITTVFIAKGFINMGADPFNGYLTTYHRCLARL